MLQTLQHLCGLHQLLIFLISLIIMLHLPSNPRKKEKKPYSDSLPRYKYLHFSELAAVLPPQLSAGTFPLCCRGVWTALVPWEDEGQSCSSGCRRWPGGARCWLWKAGEESSWLCSEVSQGHGCQWAPHSPFHEHNSLQLEVKLCGVVVPLLVSHRVNTAPNEVTEL